MDLLPTRTASNPTVQHGWFFGSLYVHLSTQTSYTDKQKYNGALYLSIYLLANPLQIELHQKAHHMLAAGKVFNISKPSVQFRSTGITMYSL